MNNTEKQNLFISFSFGRSSAVMTYLLLNDPDIQSKYNMIVGFCNTGKEREETLIFGKMCDDIFNFNTVWLEGIPNPLNKHGMNFRIVSFETADRKGKVFEEHIKKYGIPNMTYPSCSRQMKQETVRSYCRSIGWVGKNYKTAIGIRIDEPKRLNWITAKKNNLIYPLATIYRKTKSDINKFWNEQSFDLQLKSYEGNCDFCWKKSFRKLMTIAKENPQLLSWWQEMEQKYGNYIPESRSHNKDNIKLPIHFFRDNLSVADIVEDAKFDFKPAIDESKIIDAYKQSSLWDINLDQNDGCTESCEAFS